MWTTSSKSKSLLTRNLAPLNTGNLYGGHRGAERRGPVSYQSYTHASPQKDAKYRGYAHIADPGQMRPHIWTWFISWTLVSPFSALFTVWPLWYDGQSEGANRGVLPVPFSVLSVTAARLTSFLLLPHGPRHSPLSVADFLVEGSHECLASSSTSTEGACCLSLRTIPLRGPLPLPPPRRRVVLILVRLFIAPSPIP